MAALVNYTCKSFFKVTPEVKFRLLRRLTCVNKHSFCWLNITSRNVPRCRLPLKIRMLHSPFLFLFSYLIRCFILFLPRCYFSVRAQRRLCHNIPKHLLQVSTIILKKLMYYSIKTIFLYKKGVLWVESLFSPIGIIVNNVGISFISGGLPWPDIGETTTMGQFDFA